MNLLQFFKEDNGNLSNTRLLATECVNAGLFIAMYAVISRTLTVEVIGLVTSLVMLGVTGKVAGKAFEQKVGDFKVEN